MNDIEMRLFINRSPWIFAKTYADICPHEYIVKAHLDGLGRIAFGETVQFIMDKGFEAFYEARMGTYYILDDYYYWTMGAPIEETTILNRARLSDYILMNKEWVYKGKATERADKGESV